MPPTALAEHLRTNETALITGTLKATFLGLWNKSLSSDMFGPLGSEEGKVLILTWDSEFSGLNALGEGSLPVF